MEPISVCELEDGNPNHHVPRFQMMALSSNARIMATLCHTFWSMSKSVGSRFTMPIATVMPPVSTPRKLNRPDHATAVQGWSELV